MHSIKTIDANPFDLLRYKKREHTYIRTHGHTNTFGKQFFFQFRSNINKENGEI